MCRRENAHNCLNCFTNSARILAQLRRHHPNIDISGTRKKPQKQETFPTAFRMKLQANSTVLKQLQRQLGFHGARYAAVFRCWNIGLNIC